MHTVSIGNYDYKSKTQVNMGLAFGKIIHLKYFRQAVWSALYSILFLIVYKWEKSK